MLYLIINKHSPILTRTRINIFKLYINPILTYAGVAWAPYLSKTQWRKLEAVQTIAIRAILGPPIYLNNQAFLSIAGLTTIKSNIKKQSITLFIRNEKSRYIYIRELGRTEHLFPSIINNPKPRSLTRSSTPL